MNVFYVEPPYDRGYPWKLVCERAFAVISEKSAIILMARLNIPQGRDGAAGKINDSSLPLHPAIWTDPLKISKRASLLLVRIRKLQSEAANP